MSTPVTKHAVLQTVPLTLAEVINLRNSVTTQMLNHPGPVPPEHMLIAFVGEAIVQLAALRESIESMLPPKAEAVPVEPSQTQTAPAASTSATHDTASAS